MNLNLPQINPGKLSADDFAELGDYASTEQFAELIAADRREHIEACKGPRDNVRRIVNAESLHIPRDDQSDPAPGWVLGLILAFSIGVPMLALVL